MGKLAQVRRVWSTWWALPVAILVVSVGASGTIVATKIVNFQQQASQSQLFTYECNKLDPNSLECGQQFYATITKQKGVTSAFSTIKQAYATDPSVKAGCHQLTHAIGRAAAEQSEGVEAAYSKGDSFCWSGYYHGVMELMVKRVGVQNVDAKLASICTSLKKKEQYSFNHYNCVHGLGHGIMAINDNELFDALKRCDRLTDSWEASSCHGGAFMENVMAGINPGATTNYLNPDQPLYPCTAVDERYKGQCYLMQTSQALKVLGYDYAKVFELCAGVGSYAATCYQSLGRDASGNSTSNVEQTRDICMLGKDDEARVNCVTGAVKDFVSYYHDDKQAAALCNAFEPSLRERCHTVKTDYYKSL